MSSTVPLRASRAQCVRYSHSHKFVYNPSTRCSLVTFSHVYVLVPWTIGKSKGMPTIERAAGHSAYNPQKAMF
jgi:hypothetical protein